MIGSHAQSIWIAIGLLGQALFGARFVVQWLHSEILGKSRFPRLRGLQAATVTIRLRLALMMDPHRLIRRKPRR